jgi:hypothetical protein
MATEKPWWVKQRRFAVPATLRDRIEGLPEQERLFYCYIVNKVRYETKDEPLQSEGISSTYFQNFIGSGYRRYVEQLREWQIIQVNDHYLNADGHGFTKSYRIHQEALEAPIVKIRFDKKQAQPLKDHSEITDEVADFVLANCRRVGVKPELANQGNEEAEVDAEDFAERIYWGQFNVRYGGKVQRLFHTIIEMPSAARANLVFKADPAVHLCEYDVKSCHPVLLLTIMEDDKEKAGLMDLLSEDFYSVVAKECGVDLARDTIKMDFLKFANGRTRNYFHQYFTCHFPRLTQYLDEHKDGVAAFGQNAEAVILVNEVPRWLMDYAGRAQPTGSSNLKPSKSSLTSWGNPEDILYVPMHDGWLGIERDEVKIANHVRDRFRHYTQFWVTITKKDLVTGEQAILLEGPPKHAVERMRRYGGKANP